MFRSPLAAARPASLDADACQPSLATRSLPTSPERFAELLDAGLSAETVEVRLMADEFELIEHSLRALGHAPGYDYVHVTAARSLADRLKTATPVAASCP